MSESNGRIMRFKIGDRVRPRLQWRDDPNRIPSGIVRRIEPWGDDGALYVGDEKRAFAAYVFEHVKRKRTRSRIAR